MSVTIPLVIFYFSITCIHIQVLAMLWILSTDPNTQPDPEIFRARQESIRKGVPAVILHPSIDIHCCRRIAQGMHSINVFALSFSANDTQNRATTPLNELDHIQALINQGGQASMLRDVHRFMTDMKIPGGDKMARSFHALVRCPFTQYILDNCRAVGMTKFPVALGSVHRTHGTYS